MLWVKNSGSTATYDAYAFTEVELVETAITLSSTPNLLAQPVGSVIQFASSVAGAAGPYEYKFRLGEGIGVVAPQDETWTVPQDYSVVSSWSWDTLGLAPGTYRIVLWVKGAGSLTEYDAYDYIDIQLY